MLIHIANVTCKTSLKSQSISQIHLIYNFKGAQPDHVRVQSASCCFPRELVSFIRPRELERFNPWHVTRSPPIRKRIWVGRCNKCSYVIVSPISNTMLKLHDTWIKFIIITIIIIIIIIPGTGSVTKRCVSWKRNSRTWTIDEIDNRWQSISMNRLTFITDGQSITKVFVIIVIDYQY